MLTPQSYRANSVPNGQNWPPMCFVKTNLAAGLQKTGDKINKDECEEKWWPFFTDVNFSRLFTIRRQMPTQMLTWEVVSTLHTQTDITKFF